jgi:hypothetical protein
MKRPILAWLARMAVLLALAGQVRAGAVVAQDSAPDPRLAALEAALVFCHGAQGASHHQLPDRHRLSDQAILRMALAADQGAVLLGGCVSLPLPRAGAFIRAFLPAPRGPPARRIAASYPRGPPVRV